ncbi:DUF4864 domain-containing protein [Tistrella mobilis]|uniref:DUF4864 domain-containing protein n=1 Tax=Tistrella mobilis TaxID=171437 RepID=UPI003558F741
MSRQQGLPAMGRGWIKIAASLLIGTALVVVAADHPRADHPARTAAPVAVAADTAERSAVIAAIDRQLAALARDDAAAAFAMAAPALQARFGTPDRFLRMVHHAYPAVIRPVRVDYGPAWRLADGRFVQRAILQTRKGGVVMAVYTLEVVDGRHRITGCFLFDTPAEAV